MRKQIALIGLFSLMSISLTGCGTHVGYYANADKYLAGNQTYEEEISSIDIDWISGSVTLVEDETVTGVKVEEVTDLTKEKEWVHSYIDNGKLMIKFFASNTWCSKMFGYTKELTVTYHPGLESVNVDLTSGSLKAESITATDVNIDMTSGKANVNKIVADSVDVDLTSGDIEIKDITAKEFDADLTSGTITVGFTSINKGSFDLTSGKINMTLPSDGGTVKVSKTSGSVSTERECSVNNSTYKFGSGAAQIDVSMTSGKLIIK
jgi:hypothetical protein